MLTDTRKSRYAKAYPLGAGDVEFKDGFWKDVRETIFYKTVPQLENMFTSKDISHVVENFKICAGEAEGDFDGTVFGDGDFYKWMESALYTASSTGDEKLFERLDEYIDLIGRAQQSDGYISTKQIIGEMRKNGTSRMGDINDFEVYNFGHLFTSAALHNRITGKRNFLKIAEHAATYLENMYRESEEKGEVQTAVCPSHYMGLIELYRVTGDERYLKLARKAVELRDSVKNGLDDNQDRLPLKKHRKIIGHAVRANYLYAGVADLFLEEGNEEYLEVLESVWRDLLSHKIYVTGGCGALYNGASPYGNFFNHQLIHQAYGYDYQLPNITAYNETCANIGLVMWAYRMFMIEPRAEYFDVIEKVMLNTNLASISLDGLKYFYENMLERSKNAGFDPIWPLHRTSYITSYCCPPNLARNLSQSIEYLYAISGDTVYTGMYAASRANIRLEGGLYCVLECETGYPYDGKLIFKFTDITKKGAIKLALRIPTWAKSGKVTVTVNSQKNDFELSRENSGTYCTVDVSDPENTQVELDLDMPVRYTQANDLVEESRGRVCVERGPLLYCMEDGDVKSGETEAAGLKDVYLKSSANDSFSEKHTTLCERDIQVLDAKLLLAVHNGDAESDEQLYREMPSLSFKEVSATMIPYFAWDNRGEDKEMRIWFPICYR